MCERDRWCGAEQSGETLGFEGVANEQYAERVNDKQIHFDDVQKLLNAFRKLIDGGGSLLVIEHNLDVIKSADWVIDMGPEGGSAGGEIVATGTPEQIAANPRSHTGHYLAPFSASPHHAKPLQPELVIPSRTLFASQSPVCFFVCLVICAAGLYSQRIA